MLIQKSFTRGLHWNLTWNTVERSNPGSCVALAKDVEPLSSSASSSLSFSVWRPTHILPNKNHCCCRHRSIVDSCHFSDKNLNATLWKVNRKSSFKLRVVFRADLDSKQQWLWNKVRTGHGSLSILPTGTFLLCLVCNSISQTSSVKNLCWCLLWKTMQIYV